ncbi:MAG: hypothetical protein MR270_00355 [Erysipelotrichaceae bacterium]|nr:hypothetical protein [Erysipelotrichaceae bacterium]
MKKNKILIMALTSLLLTSCGNNTLSSSNDITSDSTSEKLPWEDAKNNRVTLTIYMDESNVYGPYVKGVDENIVKEAIEKKFYEDTGNAVNFNILYESHATFSNSFSPVMGSSGWDGAVSYLGQAGLEDTILNQDVVLDLTSLFRKGANNILSSLGDSINSVTNFNDEIIGIPSINITKQKGVLVRKDYMRQVGYTESKEEADASNGTLKWCQSIKDFDTMIRKMKDEIVACTTPLSGPVYDMEFTLLAGAYQSTGYQYRAINYNDDNSIKEVVPGWISENYGKVLQQEYDWVVDGLWERDNTTISANQRLSNLAAGKSAVYFLNPTITNLIDVARKCKEINNDAEFVILDPLCAVDENGNAIEDSGKFVEVSKNTDCLVLNKKSKKAELLIKYMDWMYSSKENYELCAYGIKGEQWMESSYGDNYYEYPDEYYVTHKPYSGAFALVHNDEISYRIPMQYSETERNWIEKVRNYPCLKNPTDGMLFYGASAQVSKDFITAEADIYLNCATKAWAGVLNPSETWPESVSQYRAQAGNYIEWLTNQFKLYEAARK